MSSSASSLPPGFRFHPTDEELILHYLRNRAASLPLPVNIIAEVDIYKFDPWELPERATFGDREWYFFSPRDRKYPNGVRPNRAAVSGYWKATGTDKPIITKGNENVGVKKALVFYKGKPPKGEKTNWIMHEYRLSEAYNNRKSKPIKLRESSMRLDDWVLCRIYQKSSHASPTDREQEESVGDDTQIPKLSNNTEENNLQLHKSFSLTELLDEADFSLLSRLLDNPNDMPVLENDYFGYQSFNQSFIENSNGNSYLLPLQHPKKEESVSVPDKSLKRQRGVDVFWEEDGGHLQPSKKEKDSLNHPSFSNHFDNSFFNQQLLMNSHFGF